jgi:mTERF domain-containing protein, mitochondrial
VRDSAAAAMLPSVRIPLARLHSVHLLSALQRLLLYSTTSSPASPFAAEYYLVTTCDLTPTQARRVSKYLPHVKSPDNPDAVRAFLAGIGLSKSDLATAVTKFPRLLCSRVDRTLTPRVAQLHGIGLSLPQISRLVTVVPNILTNPGKIPRLAFFLSYFGSFDQVHTALRRNDYLLTKNVELVVKPNLEFLQQCGLTSSDIALSCSRMITWDLERIKETVARAEELGVPRNTGMFRYALTAVGYLSPSRISARLDFLENALGCSEAELAIAVCKLPYILRSSDAKLGRAANFLKNEIGLETQYIVRRPAMLNYSMDKRVMPRHYVMKVLKAKGLVKGDIDFYTLVSYSEKIFVKKFLIDSKMSVPGLLDAYAAACKGKVLPNVKLGELEMDM